LNVFLLTPFAVANQYVYAMIGDTEVVTLGIGTGVPIGGDALLATTGAFALGMGNFLMMVRISW
jgi:hypothetical protein